MNKVLSFSLSHKKILSRITCGVIFAHLLLLLHVIFFYRNEFLSEKPKEKRLAVKTITLNPTPQQVVVVQEEPAPEIVEEIIPEAVVEEVIAPEPIPESVIPEPVVIEEAPFKPEPKAIDKPKPVVKKKSVPTKKKKAAPKAKAAPKKKAAKTKIAKKSPPKPEPKHDSKPDPKPDPKQEKRRDLLASAQKSFAKIGTQQNKSTPSLALSVPSKIENLQVETFAIDGELLSATEQTYYDELANRLKLLLKLPEFGEVKVKLTLKRTGNFSKLAIVTAASSENRHYLEKSLPKLTYPSFGENFENQTEHTFLIALSNDL